MGDTFSGSAGKELYIGVPLFDAGLRDYGVVYEVRSSGSFDPVNTAFSQSSLPGFSAESGDRFGWALACGDFDGNGRADLAIGAPTEDVFSTVDAGIVHIIPSLSGALSESSARGIWQGSGVHGSAETGDLFGASLSAWNFGRDAAADLAIGVPYEDFVSGGISHTNAGQINVLYGAQGTGLSTTGEQIWNQALLGGGFEDNDLFGYALY
jgi:hypothetical protein